MQFDHDSDAPAESSETEPNGPDGVSAPVAVPVARDAAPVTGVERITAIDVLRGLAVFGILVMNIKAFSLISAAYMNPMALGPLDGAERWVWLIEHHFFDMKMMSIFSMLFGAGIVLMTGRSEARTGRSAGIHYRRMGWLILFGLIHAHVFWHGDILFVYGVCGLLLFLFRRFHPAVLIVLGLFSMLIASGLSLGAGLSYGMWPPESQEQMIAFWAPDAEAIRAETEAFRGGWLAQGEYRNMLALSFEINGFVFFGWRIIGNMMIGMALFKLGALSAAWSSRAYMAMVAVGAVVGLPLISMGVRANEAAGWTVAEGMFINGQFNYWASVVVALGWIGVVMLVVKSGAVRWLTSRLAAAGQMALTNYLAQTLVCTLLFYGHGFGLFGKLDRFEQELVVLAICTVQLLVSPIWLAKFRFGPMEWLWRSLSYWKLQPMTR